MGDNYTELDSRQKQTVAQVLANRIAKYGEKTWIVCNGQQYSYIDMDRRSNSLAHGLRRQGISKGDTVLLMFNDGVEILVAWVALAKIGAMEVPVNTQLKGNVLAHIINNSCASMILMHDEFVDRIDQVADDLDQLQRVVIANTQQGSETHSALESTFDVLTLEELYQESESALETTPAYNDLVAVMYTSGTTGPSKGVMVTHAHAYEYALGVVELLELREDDVYYNPLPLFHIAGQWAAVYACLIAGATVVVSGKFSLERFWPQVREYHCTCTFLLGAMANWLYRQPQNDDDSDNPMQRMLVVPLLPEIEDFKQRFGVKVSTTWGSTEINVPTRSSFTLANNKTCGWVTEDRYEVRIVDENDQELPPGQAGEAVVRSKEPWILMAGYWNNPEATAKAWRNQWVHTGDMLMKDEKGNLYFIDRTKDAIRRRGENISSMEVENEINAHEDVLECAVVPVASEYSEQEVMAVIVPKPGITIDPVEFIRFLEPRMARFMLPRYIDLVEVLPKTATGKIQKFALRERGLTPTTWDRERADSD
ncbi:MAG: AMP-binding protein [Arenicellales bacterium]|nr:AMP-binding protein [Arenicellales bacterium]